MAQQIYAKIKKSSKYFYQNDFAKERNQFPFPVEISGHPLDYCVKADIGQYRLKDVALFVIVDGDEFPLSGK